MNRVFGESSPRADLERLPQQEVHRSAQLKDLSIGTVRLAALLDQPLSSPRRAPRSPRRRTTADAQSLSAREIEGALARVSTGRRAAQLGWAAARSMLVSGGQIVSVQRLRGIHLSDEGCAAVAHDAA